MADFIMPSLGADMTEGLLVTWRVKPGDRVRQGDIMAEIETQKGLFEIEAFAAGVVGPLLVQPGPDKIAVGTVLTIISPAVESSSPAPVTTDKRLKVTPVARKLAAENNIDLNQISATGADDAICLADVERALVDVAEGNLSDSATEEKAPTDFKAGIRQAIASAMSLSNRDIPHYYLAADIDMSQALEWLAEYNRQRSVRERLLPVVLSLKAVALALKKVPELNAHWIDNQLQLKQDVHIGFAVALRGGGLMTPVVHQVDKLALDELMAALADLITRTRSGKLRGSDMVDGGITVTSLGDLGVREVFGVIYPPQVALVGLGRIADRPWAENRALSVRPVQTVTLAADHRAGDGLMGAQFMEILNRLLQEPEKL